MHDVAELTSDTFKLFVVGALKTDEWLGAVT